MEEFIDYQNLHKQEFHFRGNYRAIVEDTTDPLNSGRVRVRVLGLHSPDPDVTPVEHLIWAEPALSLYYGGGQMTTRNLNDEITDRSRDRYYPTKDLESAKDDIPDQDVTELTPNDGRWKDRITDRCGASAFYSVPRKGSVVWVFFENGYHGRAHYWAAATRAIDWEFQRDKIDLIINQKRDELENLRNAVTDEAGEQRIDQDDHQDSTRPVQRLKVFTKIPDPKLFIHTLDNIRNEEISSFTSSFGTTYIIVNKNGQERTYVFHRGHAEYVDERGQVKKLIGLSDNEEVRGERDSDISQDKQANDYQMFVGNNYDLHIIGDFNVYAKNNIHLDAEQDLYAVVRRNAGIAVKKGDLDVICEEGHANVSCPRGNVNIRCQEAQAKIEKNLVAEVNQDIDAVVRRNVYLNVEGSTNIRSQGEMNILCDSDINIESQQDINIKAANINQQADSNHSTTAQSQFSVTSPGTVDILGGAASFKLSSSLAQLGAAQTDIAGNTSIGGTVAMGASQGPPQGAQPVFITPLNIQPWQDWRPSNENIEKEFNPNEQQVNDEDS